MAAPGGRYFIQDKLDTPAVHHESFKALWEMKWKAPCEMGVYPFMYGAIEDFEPVVEKIIAAGLKPPYDWDEYASYFFDRAQQLVRKAESTENNNEMASEMFLRASALYRIARFPAPRSEQQRLAWNRGKAAALAGQRLQRYAMDEILIPHTTHATSKDGSTLPGYYHLPESASADQKVPLIIIFTGLDGYRTELCVWKDGFAALGVAVLVVEIPGTGDNPGDPSDPEAPDRVWDSMFDWVALQDEIDQSRVVNWGFSTGGYYSIRTAHTHVKKWKGVVALGGGCHHMFDPEWLDRANTMEYPFDLAHTLAYKFGYGTDFERFKKEARDRYSLLTNGILNRPQCARLLLVNGTEDEIFPIDDYYLCLQHGAPKEARFVNGIKHMGEPASFGIILNWLFRLLEVPGDVGKFMVTIPFKPKYSLDNV